MKEAPLYVDVQDLARWITENLPAVAPLEARIHTDVLCLLDAVVLALKADDETRGRQVSAADVTLTLLRAHLRLASETGRLSERRFVFLAEKTDAIGRQIGGWKRKLAGATLAPRRRSRL